MFYNIVLLLANIEMNPPQVYPYSPSWTLLPPPSPYPPSGWSQCTSPKHPVSCIDPGLAISLHWSLKKAFLSLLAILWNSGFKYPFEWVYLSFSPLPFTSLLFSAICKASSDNYFAICISVLGDDLDPCLLYNVMNLCPWFIRYSIRSNPLKPFVTSLVYSQGIWFRSCLNGLVVFPTFFNLSLNWAIKSSWSEPQSAPSLVFADCIELLHLWLQRI